MRVDNKSDAQERRAALEKRLAEKRALKEAQAKKVPAYAKNNVADESQKLKEGETNDFDIVLKNFKAHKLAKLGESKVTYKEVRALREAVAEANKKGIKLAEADENFTAPAADPNAAAAPAPAADPNAAASGVSPDVQTQIQSLLSQVQALAQAAGIQTADFGADPNANVPAVDGMAQPTAADGAAPADPNAPLMEAVAKAREANNGKCDEATFVDLKAQFGKALVESLGVTRDRIAMRSAKLDTLNEKFEGDFASAYFENVGLKEAISPIAGIPSEKEVAHGTADAAKGLAKELKTPVAWPDHQITGAPLQGEGAKQQKVKESTSAVTDAYVKDFYAPKLSLDNIRESMKNGILG